MPTIFTHAVIPATLAIIAGRGRISPPILFTGIVLAMLPDADVIGFMAGVDYASAWGHRGVSHALVIAAILAMMALALLRPPNRWPVFAFLFVSAASHGLLDALTSGGLGPALLWPWTQERFFFPVRPLRVSPIGADFFSARGLATLMSEFKWVWLPCLVLAGSGVLIRRAPAASVRGSGRAHQFPD